MSLRFRVGERELHEVSATLASDAVITLSVDGAPRAEVRLQEMLGGYGFSLGETERHRVELFHIDAQRPFLEACVDGRLVASSRPVRPARSVLAPWLVGLVGAWTTALGLAVLFGGGGGAFALGLGHGRLAVGVGLLLLGIAPFVWRLSLAASVAAVVVELAYAVLMAVQLARAGISAPPWPYLAAHGTAVLLLALAAILIWRKRSHAHAPLRPWRIDPAGSVGVRCPVHAGPGRATCDRCGRPLCEDCAAFRQRDALLCQPCARGHAPGG